MIGCVRWRFSEVGSTQDVGFRLAEKGSRHGTVVRADFQSAGRGRQGKRWESDPGSSLMFSVILRPTLPPHQLGTTSVLVAEALADTFASTISQPINIKWPNDVLIDGRKASGILLQNRGSVAVLGIGINIQSPVDSIPETATCLNHHTEQPVDVEAVFNSILMRLNHMWNSLQPELTRDQVARLDSKLWRRGDAVTILDADREVKGHMTGVARSGGLRLVVDGQEREIVAGEIVRGPRPIA